MTKVNAQQGRSQDFVHEGLDLLGGPRYPYQKLKTYRISPTIFGEGPKFTK